MNSYKNHDTNHKLIKSDCASTQSDKCLSFSLAANRAEENKKIVFGWTYIYHCSANDAFLKAKGLRPTVHPSVMLS